MEDIIGRISGGDGNIVELKLKDCYATCYDITKLLYLDFMSRVLDAEFEEFKRIQLNCTEKIIDRIHEKYQDHAEGIRMHIFEECGIDDPKREELDV